MPQSFGLNPMHIIFSTKNRSPLIKGKELFKYAAGICNSLGCQTIAIGGYSDHIHILCYLSKNIALSKLVQDVKTSTSRWMKTKGTSNFYWQSGYAGFPADPKDLDALIAYINHQEEHHRRLTFKEEYRKVLSELDIVFDERYVWD